jgi:predicted site-specific integrase-resolvase
MATSQMDKSPATKIGQASGPERLLTVDEVGELLQLSPQFVRDHAREIGGIRLGGSSRKAGRLRFSPERVKQYIEKSEREYARHARAS